MNEPVPGVGPAARDWPRALALFLAAFGLFVFRPSVLVGIPLVLLLLIFPTPRLWGLLAAVVVAMLAFGGTPGEGLWYAERGWAILLGGAFVAATAWWPGAGLFARSGAAVGSALLISASVLVARPGSWQILDWLVADRMRSAVSSGLAAMETLWGNGVAPSSEVVSAVVELQAQVFPALVALSSLAALGVAWWLYMRLGYGRGGSLSPVKEFSFNDHLVWLLIAGIALLVIGWGGGWGRAGSNVVVFMAALYALRGVAVVLFVTGGFFVLGAVLLGVSFRFVAPLLLAVALFVGVGDTWLGLRQRVRGTPSGTQ